MKDFTNANNLIQGYKRAERAGGWKESSQHYGLNLLRSTRKLQDELRGGTYRQAKGATFTLYEQGRERLVKALTVRDGVMQHALCDSELVPVLTRHMIHDNGASIKHKGISFTRRRLERHLR